MNVPNPITDTEAVDITAGLLFREMLDVVTASTEPAEATITHVSEAARTVLDAAHDLLGPERGRRITAEALALVLARVRGPAPA